VRLIEGNQCLGGLSVEAQLGLAEEGLEGGVTLIYPGVDREPSAGLVFLFAGLSVLMSIAVEASDSDGPVSMVRSLLAWSAGASFAIRSYS
jgi:hypothetical protein